MSYKIEVRLASKNGWHTPAEARKYYGRYNRTGITVHWWGDGTGASNHDNIVNYFLRQGEAGAKSTNYVLSDNKITLMVNPDNVAWTAQNGNPTDVQVETQPTLKPEGYKKWGWLVKELEGRYGRKLTLHPHKFWYSTACPGSISLDKIAQERDKWKRGDYNPKPVPKPTPAPTPPKPAAKITWEEWKEGPREYVLNKDAHLWNFNSDTWQMTSIKKFKKGERITIFGQGKNIKLNAVYYVTQYSFNNKITNGFNPADLDVYVAPRPVPEPPKPPVVVEPPKPTVPEWAANLRDIDNTTYWFKQDTELIDITTGKPTGKLFKKDEEFVGSALTKVGNTEYRITEYSFTKKVFNGVPIDKLTLTAPGVPDLPPVPNYPDNNAVVAFLELLVKMITEFISKFKKG